VTSTVRSGSSLSLDVELGESVWSSSISRRRGTENEWTRWPRLAADASSSTGSKRSFRGPGGGFLATAVSMNAAIGRGTVSLLCCWLVDAGAKRSTQPFA
jgi:hypothetical protein